ncbi:TPA: DUF72 domain-containing protein [Candidatus Bathyarchaeota archaeon]|nr:DUF72 domain-containing protein [Candidatus Bathyarchaeota archaeon]
MIKVGCCGFAGGMGRYFGTFDVVEVQRTFYKPPLSRTAERWRRLAPEGFEFTVKCFQAVTHPATSPTYRKAGIAIPPEKRDRYGFFRPTEEVIDAWERTKGICRALDARICVVQCPASFRATEESIRNMEAFFSSIDRDGIVMAWEPRGRSWTDDLVRSLCERLDLTHVVDPFAREPVALTGGVAYFRLHGKPPGEAMYRYQYDDGELSSLAERARRLEEEGNAVYVMFNNLVMLDDATRFSAYLGEGSFPPILPSGREGLARLLQTVGYPAGVDRLLRRLGWRLVGIRGRQARLDRLLRLLEPRPYASADDVLEELDRKGLLG